jgi:hypothetical protein
MVRYAHYMPRTEPNLQRFTAAALGAEVVERTRGAAPGMRQGTVIAFPVYLNVLRAVSHAKGRSAPIPSNRPWPAPK